LVVAVSVVVSPERGEFSFIGSGVVEQARWGVETKSREIEVENEPSPHSRSTEKKGFGKRVVLPHRILTFGHTGILRRV
jgi:hypothetical protein